MKIEINAKVAKENTKKVLNTVKDKANSKAKSLLSFLGITITSK